MNWPLTPTKARVPPRVSALDYPDATALHQAGEAGVWLRDDAGLVGVDLADVDPAELGLDPEPACFTDRVRDLGGVQQCLVGMHPACRQVPRSFPFSTIETLRPSCVARSAQE
jgi:hypothetical protein